ncbi:MAG: slipin family protein [bacterium]|jgi:regulator of protease activity HflC (stomatin/prohibitin superfamily)|nr:slipin family protein [bacterium]
MNFLPGIIILGIVIISMIKIINEYERAVIFRLGRLIPSKGPGLIIVLPLIDRLVKVDMRTITMDVPSQDVITRDNVPVRVNAVVYFRVMNPENAIVQVENFILATSQIAQTTLRSVLGQAELDELLSKREKINLELQKIIDDETDPWGIKVTIVEIKDVELPKTMQRAMARQAEAERERRAKIIAAKGEFEASEKLAEAARVIEPHPVAIQLRYLQTLVEISTEQSSTTIFPLPLNLIEPFLQTSAAKALPKKKKKKKD